MNSVRVTIVPVTMTSPLPGQIVLVLKLQLLCCLDTELFARPVDCMLRVISAMPLAFRRYGALITAERTCKMSVYMAATPPADTWAKQ